MMKPLTHDTHKTHADEAGKWLLLSLFVAIDLGAGWFIFQSLTA